MPLKRPAQPRSPPWRLWPPQVVVAMALGGVALIGITDYLLPPVYSLSLVYLLPVAAAAWFAGFGMGALVALASTIAVLVSYSNPAYPATHVTHWAWMTGLHATFMFAFAFVVARLHARTVALAVAQTGSERALLRTMLSEARFRALFDESPLGIALTDSTTGRIDDFNPAFQRICARTRDEIVASDWLFHTHPDDLASARSQLERMLAGELPGFRLNTRHLRPDGTVVWVDLAVVPINIGAREHRHHLTILEDVTERVLAEAQLRSAKERLELATSAGDIGVWSFDFAAGRQEWDDRLCAWYQVPDAMRQAGITEEFWLSRLHPDDRERVRGMARDAFPPERRQVADFRVMLPDGTLRHLHSAWVVEHDAAGKPTRLIGINRDVTGEHEQSEALLAAKLAADTANTAKSAFLASVSHEIRTPMNAVLGIAQMLAMEDVPPAERIRNARIIIESGRDLLALINHLLDVAKIEAGKLTLEELPFEPQVILDDVEALCRGRAANKGLLLRMQWSGPRSACYRGDPLRLRQMLTNLVDNAIKFTSSGSVRVDATVIEGIADGALLEFGVTDTGIGIPPERQHLLFQPFSQADRGTTRQYGGTGLGLSIVQSLARLMQGSAGVESRPGQGSRFWFRVRVGLADTPQEVDGAPVVATASEVPKSPSVLSGRVLVVEDHPLNREVIAGMLTRLGLEVIAAANGLEAVTTIVGGDRPDLVLMDIHMPVLDGHGATRRIREWENETGQAPLPIIALTADAYEANRRHCLALGMDEFVAKPIDFNNLAAVLRRWLGSERGGKTEATRPVGPATPAARGPLPTPEGAPPESTLPLFDESAMLSLFEGDRGLATEIVTMAMRQIPAEFSLLETALAAGDPAAMKRLTHTLKGLVAQIGGTRLAHGLRRADAHLAQGETIDAAMIVAWRDEFANLTAALRDRDYLDSGPFDA